MCVLFKESQEEIKLQRKIKDIVEKEVKDKGYSKKFLAEKLGLLQSGVDLLFERQIWSLSLGFRIAVALGLEVTLNVK